MKAWTKKQLRKTWVVFILLIFVVLATIIFGKLFPLVVGTIAAIVIFGCLLWFVGYVLWQIAEAVAEEFW